MKKFFFILVVLVSCGSEGAELGDVDGGVDSRRTDSRPADLLPSDSVRSDTTKAAPGTCVIPEPKFSKTSFSLYPLTSKPRVRYQVVTGTVFCTTKPNPAAPLLALPTDCSSPVDGFSDGKTSWCCVLTQGGASLGAVSCIGPKDIVSEDTPGAVADCTPDGQFLGWDCSI